MKILFLTNNNISLELYNWLKVAGENVELEQNKIIEIKENYDLIISYSYKYIINKNIVEKFKNRIINLHISYLPWNRGADPNIWSFLENTPKGVTIHFIDEGIDTGDILYQKEIVFNDEKETLKSSYEQLQREIQILFKENWAKIKNLDFNPLKQNSAGSFHKRKDLEKIKYLLNNESWDITIDKLKLKYQQLSKQIENQ